MLQSVPLFHTESGLTAGLKRYYTQQTKKKIASTNALSKRCKAIKPNELALTSYLMTGIILINETARKLQKEIGLPGSEMIYLTALATAQYGGGMVTSSLFYFAGGKGQASRKKNLLDSGHIILVPNHRNPRQKSIVVTETGQAIADRFTLELSDKVERLGIIKG